MECPGNWYESDTVKSAPSLTPGRIGQAPQQPALVTILRRLPSAVCRKVARVRVSVALCCVVVMSYGCAPSWQADPWYYAGHSLITYDLLCQTTQINDNPGLHENNPLLGKHPSDNDIVTYWAGSLIVYHLAYVALRRWQPGSERYLSIGASGAQAWQVGKNERGHHLRCW